MADEQTSREGNLIRIRRARRSNDARFVGSLIHQAVRFEGHPAVILDFSECGNAYLAGMLPLLPIVEHMRTENGVNFELREPKDFDLRRLFRNANWSHLLQPDAFPASDFQGHYPARRFRTSDEVADITKDICEIIYRVIKLDRSAVGAVEWALNEIMDNVLDHAESEVAGYVEAATFDKSNRVEFVVADAGVGIPYSLGIPDSADALRKAISREGTRHGGDLGRGNGLHGSFEIARLSINGEFDLSSDVGYLYYNREDDEVVAYNHSIPYRGTALRCAIGLDRENLFSDALEFGKYQSFDHVEREFEDDEGNIVFAIKEQAAKAVATRQGGREIRVIIENLLRDAPELTVDFSGVGVISSSFADEVFGRLFVSLGPRGFMRRIKIINADSLVEGLIDRALLQRAQLGNGESEGASDAVQQ